MILVVGRRLALAAVIFAAAACSGVAQASPSAGGVAATAVPATPSVTASAPAAVRVVQPLASIKVGNLVGGMVVGPTGLWALTDTGIVRIDPATNKVVTSYPLTPSADGYGLAVSDNALWLTVFDSDLVYRMDPATGKRVATIASPPGPGPITVFNGEVWFGGHHAGNINRIDPKTNTIVATVPVNPPGRGGPGDIVPIQQGLWVGFGDYPEVVVVDPRSAKVNRSVPIPDTGGVPFEVGPGHVWVTNDSGIAVLDPTLSMAPGGDIDLGGSPGYGAVVNDGAAWVPVELHSSSPPGELVAIDLATHAMVDRISLADGAPDQVLQAFGSDWVELGLQGTIDRLAPAALTVSH
jgi:virginiamycin B lyase